MGGWGKSRLKLTQPSKAGAWAELSKNVKNHKTLNLSKILILEVQIQRAYAIRSRVNRKRVSLSILSGPGNLKSVSPLRT